MFHQRLKQLRKEAKLSQAALAQQLDVTQQAVGKWESGKSMPDADTLSSLADIFSTTLEDLLDKPAAALAASAYPQVRIPVVGTVRAGYGAFAFEEDYGTESAAVKDPSSYFYLVVKGSSMEPRIQEGDLALVHKQPTLENGDLGVLIYGEEGEGTLKRFVRRGSSVVLQPFNPEYPEMVISGSDLNNLRVVGRVVKTVSAW